MRGLLGGLRPPVIGSTEAQSEAGTPPSSQSGLLMSLSVALRRDMFVAAQMAVGGFGPMLMPFAAAAAASWT